MTIDEAIKICEEDAEKIGGNPQSDRHAERCRQLAAWLRELKDLRAERNDQYIFIKELMDELKEAKRLLKMAVSIINNSFPEVGSCWGCANHDEVNDECKGGAFAECAEVCKWKYADEALKLLNDEK